MKIKHIGIAAMALASLASCADQMDYKEYRVDDQAYMSEHWGKVCSFVMRCYLNLEYDFGQMYGGAMLASTTDEAVYSVNGHQIEDFYNGAWSATNNKAAVWTSSYESISYCNLFLDEFTGLSFPDYILDENYAKYIHWYNNFQYEVRWLRAMYYFSLVRQYGDLPFKTRHMEADEANSLPRTSYDEIFKFIDSECAVVADSIVKDYSNLGIYALNSGVENGRPNDLAAMALRARAALYHASPLFNPNNDMSRWQHAADVTKALIDSCEARKMKLCADYTKLFYRDSFKDVDAQAENIFCRRVNPSDFKIKFEQWNFPTGMTGATGGNCPSQSLVDAYEMTNGKLITDPESGYDAQNPYLNRDARFYATVATNGEHWPDAISDDTTGFQSYYGGKNGLPLTNATPTSYYLKKYVDNTIILSGNSVSSGNAHSFVVFRLGGVYLDYAEILMNLGDNATALTYVNKVRARAGQPELALEDLTRDRYENERFVELAFEGQRFFDVRRWKEAPKYFTSVKTMRITMNADSSFTYTPDAVSRQWEDKKYLFPIPQADMMKNAGGWSQNPGW